MSQNATALVQPVAPSVLADFERRASTRHALIAQGLARPVEGQDAIWWGATVFDLSNTGIGLSLCFPFRPGTYLAVDLHGPDGSNRSLLAKVIHARDQADGTWHVGCEFVKPLSDSDVEVMVEG
jgi:hypothetical protein